MPSDNVLSFLLQNALQRAYPSAPPSNQILQQISSANDSMTFADTVTATTVPLGYPYGYGEQIGNWASASVQNVDTTSYPGSATLQPYLPSLMLWGVLYSPTG